jgi:hypothetical protein
MSRTSGSRGDRPCEPAQYAVTHLLPGRGEVFRRECARVGSVDLPVYASSEHPFGYTEVEADSDPLDVELN